MSAQGLRASQLAILLKIIILKLIYNPYSLGFVVASMGHFKDQRTYGLALCHGDNALALECKTYVSDAAKEIRNRCPYNKGATIWYDYYMFKYLDTTDFIGKVDNTIRIYIIITKSQNYLRLNLFSDNNASGSSHLSRLDENAIVDATPDDYRNIGLAIDLLCRDELPLLPYLTLDSDNGKKPLLHKNSDFIPL
ncbi:hypothetical protein JHK87_034361 [Glycine soja]|nr:hypothetical protein JHK87_034361 [Glycine soja]